MKFSFASSLCAGILLATTACNPTTDTNTTTNDAAMNDGTTTDMTTDTAMNEGGTMATTTMMTDEEFMKMVATGGQNEIGLSKVALDKGVSGEMKNFANMMITDHTQAGNELKPIADRKNVMLPTEMDAEHKALRDQMQNLSGDELARTYAQQMVTDHQKTVDAFQSEIQNGKDADVKAFASKTLPTIQKHLEMARSLPSSGAM